MRAHATKRQSEVATAGYIVMCKLEGTWRGPVVPDAFVTAQWGPGLYSALDASSARPRKGITLFPTYEAANRAITTTLRNARRHFIKKGYRTQDYPKWLDRKAFVVFCVAFEVPEVSA